MGMVVLEAGSHPVCKNQVITALTGQQSADKQNSGLINNSVASSTPCKESVGNGIHTETGTTNPNISPDNRTLSDAIPCLYLAAMPCFFR
jgi:hypothetical protein